MPVVGVIELGRIEKATLTDRGWTDGKEARNKEVFVSIWNLFFCFV
jgi:hypothetical protein